MPIEDEDPPDMRDSNNLTHILENNVPCEGRDCGNFACFDRLIIDRGMCRHCNRKLNINPSSVLGKDILPGSSLKG